MKKRFTLGTVLALILLSAATAAVIAFSVARQALDKTAQDLAALQRESSKFRDVRDILLNNFIGPSSGDELQDGAIRGMVSALCDPYSHYLTAEEYEAYTTNSGNQSIGIGVIACQSPEGDILIAEVYEGSPALEKGVECRDRIVAVDGRPVSEMGYQLAVSALAGEENTRVDISLLKAADGSVRELTLVRRKMSVPAVGSEILSGQNIGLVRIRNFDPNVDRNFHEVMVLLLNADVDAVIFDVRNNPGGQLDVMCPMLDMLLPRGSLLITLRDKIGQETSLHAESDDWVDLPMVVLVNENSYSAAEFFAAALREYGRAVLVGAPTTGKGYAQIPIRLSDGSAIILSTSEYFTPHGNSLSGKGLTPDYPVNLSDDAARQFGQLPHERDSQLQKAIEVLTPYLPAEPEVVSNEE